MFDDHYDVSLRYWNSFGTKNHGRNIDNILKYVLVMPAFMHNFLCQNVLIFKFYKMLARRICTFWPKCNDIFVSGRITTAFGLENHIRKIENILKYF